MQPLQGYSMDFNKDFSKLKVGTERRTYKGRVIQADADFYCYFVAKPEESLMSNVKKLINILETNRKMMGAEHVNAHITLGSKGGRYQTSTVKPYQVSRVIKNESEKSAIKTRVAEVRGELANWVGTDTITVIADATTEADDSISEYHNMYNKSGKGISIIDSGDKDLNMNQGVHRDSYTKKLIRVTGYGITQYKKVGNVKPKLVGYGDSWFWHQMLMGDPVDGVPGLEKITGELLNEYMPLKKFNPARKDAPCGPAKAVAILSGVKSKVTAARRVFNAYLSYYGLKTKTRMVEQAFLLWMRRDGNVWDCIKYMKECGLQIEPSKEQIVIVNRWAEMMIAIHGKGCVKVKL